MHPRRLVLLAGLVALCASAPAAVAAPGKPYGGDRDRDGLRDRHEVLAGLDPANPDSDGDGVKDGREGAGTIVARRGRRLVLRLFAGGAVRAKLTDATAVLCEEPEPEEDEALDEPEVPLEREDVPEDERPAELQSLPGDGAGTADGPSAGEEDAEDEEDSGCDLDDLQRGTVVSESATAGHGKRRRWTSLALAS